MPGAAESNGKRNTGKKRLRCILGFVESAGVNFQAKDFVNSRFITRITTTITTRPMEVIGNSCASIVMIMNTRGIWSRNGMTEIHRKMSRHRPLHISRWPVSRPCWRRKASDLFCDLKSSIRQHDPHEIVYQFSHNIFMMSPYNLKGAHCHAA